MSERKKYIFFISLCLLLLSCTTLSREYENSNIIIAPENQDTSNLEYVTLLTLQTRTHLSYDDLIIKSVNEIAEKGYHDVIIIPKVIEYDEIVSSNSYNYNYNRSGRAGPMDAFNSFADTFTGVLSSIKRYYYLINFYIYKPRQDKKIPLDQKGKNLDQELSFLEIQKKAKNGDAEAQFDLFKRYYYGEGVSIDKGEAFYWIKKVAENENAKAQFNLALMYYNGEGTLVDKKQALYWYTKSAEKGVAYAQFNLALMYYYGDGILADKKQAAYWIKQAYENGYEPAKELWDADELWKYQD
ncbi:MULTISPECIES: tetratricopeptide repeat protein [unclassified Treponema]|uniref:tetratricopeptide repeat protein n=1 Tax=unclassified Treponema TaxID=2638727 RepID=UPI0020A41934|nr:MULTISPECIES: tetratricopeptide repeat protein [unclassified Treponema]